MSRPDAFNGAMSVASIWLHDLRMELGTSDEKRAYEAFLFVCHALRDRVTQEHVANLGNQLPLFARGLFYDDWHPAQKPLKTKNQRAFLTEVYKMYGGRLPYSDIEKTVRSMFKFLAGYLPMQEARSLRSHLPAPIQGLWPAW